MKKEIFKIVFFSFMFFTFFVGVAVGAENNCPVLNGTQLLQCPNSTSCTNNLDSCPPPQTGSGTSTSTTASGEKCTGNLRYDEDATKECAALAEREGRARGYNITCTTEARESVKAVNAAPIGSETMYFANCTINGQTGFSPETLVGYQGSGPGIEVHDNFFGTTTVYGAGFNLNSMWGSVPCALVDNTTGQPGTLVGSHTCAAGAAEYFGSTNPSTWRPETITNRPAPSIPSCRYTATCGLIGGIGSGTGEVTTDTGSGARSVATPVVMSRDSWYYRDPYISDSSGGSSTEPIDASGCTGYESNPDCHPEWARAGSLCNANNTTGACDPKRVNPYAAASFAKDAEMKAKQQGYKTLCSAKYVPFLPGLDPDTKLSYYYETKCILNDTNTVSAESLASGSVNLQLQPTISPSSGVSQPPILSVPSCRLTATCGTNPIGSSSSPNCFVLPTGETNCSGTDPISSGNLGAFKGIRVETSERGWIAWNEIEVYDTNGNKVSIPATGIKVSCVWCNAGSYASLDSVAGANLVNGNLGDSWNAGETAPGCNWANPATFCPGESVVRTAWVELNFGKNVNVGKISLYPQTDSSAGNKTDIVYGLTDSGKTKIVEFSGAPVLSDSVLTYPYPTNRPDPTVQLSVNGATEATLDHNGFAIIDWSSANIDYLDYTITYDRDDSLSGETIGQYEIAQCDVNNQNSDAYLMIKPFWNVVTPHMVVGRKGQTSFQAVDCAYKRNFKIHLTGYQRGIEKSASTDISIKVNGIPSNYSAKTPRLNSIGIINATAGTTSDPERFYVEAYSVLPATLTFSGLPSGISFTQTRAEDMTITDIYGTKGSPMVRIRYQIRIASGVKPGLYLGKAILNNGADKEDFLVRVQY